MFREGDWVMADVVNEKDVTETIFGYVVGFYPYEERVRIRLVGKVEINPQTHAAELKREDLVEPATIFAVSVDEVESVEEEIYLTRHNLLSMAEIAVNLGDRAWFEEIMASLPPQSQNAN